MITLSGCMTEENFVMVHDGCQIFDPLPKDKKKVLPTLPEEWRIYLVNYDRNYKITCQKN